MGQDGQIHASDAAAEGEPAKDQREQARNENDEGDLNPEAIGEGPKQREFGRADDAKDLIADSVRNFTRGGWDCTAR